MYDKVWEFSTLAEDFWAGHYQTRILVGAPFVEGGQREWAYWGEEVAFEAARWLQNDGRPGISIQAQHWAWEGDRVTKPTLKWIAETEFREPVPERMRFWWLVDGVIRYRGSPPPWEKLPESAAYWCYRRTDCQEESVLAEGCRRWLKDRRFTEADYQERVALYGKAIREGVEDDDY